MAAPDLLASILKTVYDERFDKNALGRVSSLMGSIAHHEDFHGNKLEWSVNYAGLGGRSMTATNAEGNDVNGRYASFSISTPHDYMSRTLDGQLIRKTLKGGINTQFVDYLTQEMKLAQDAINQNIARGAYASHTNKRGTRASLASTAVTLTEPGAALYFNIDDKVVAGATEGGALRAGTAAVLTGVDTAANTITSATWANITAFADGDSLYIEGDINVGYHGLGSYVPAVAPTAGDAVFGSGVDRSKNPEMLAGVRLTTTGSNVETVLIGAMAYLKTRPGMAFKDADIFCSEIDFANIQVSKEGSRFIDNSGPYELGIEAFKVGSTTIKSDIFCPQGTFFVVAKDAFELHSVDGVNIDNVDGNTMRKTANDTYKIAAVFDGDFQAIKPWGLARGTWPTA